MNDAQCISCIYSSLKDWNCVIENHFYVYQSNEVDLYLKFIL